MMSIIPSYFGISEVGAHSDQCRYQVLFASVQESETLEELQMMATNLETLLQELTGSPTAKKEFKPHLTILKLSKDFKLRRKVQYVHD
jgi:2'-5' RNA ligase